MKKKILIFAPMLQPATHTTLLISRATDNGVYLTDTDGNEVLLPNRYVPESYELGDRIEVFLYCDSEDRLVATTDTPKVDIGQVASLRVADTTRFGAFMDWGLPKDLFVPFKNQLNPLAVDEYHPVTIYVDEATNRIVGTTKIGHIVSNKEEITVKPGDQVEIIVSQRRDRGFRVIIDQKHWGMIYDNQIFSPINLGDTLTAYVTKISEDDRIDLTLQKPGFDGVQVSVDVLRSLLEENDGVMPYGDKTDPELIAAATGMSKKTFKKAAGVLLRAGEVEISDNEIRKIKK